MVLLKTLVCLFLFVLILGTALLSRLSLLEIVQQLRLINISLPLTVEQQKTCQDQSLAHVFNKSVSKDNDNVPPVLQVYWIWALFLIICFPYCIGILKNLRKILFKQTASISISILLLVSVQKLFLYFCY